MIRIENVSMKFDLGIEKNFSLKELLISIFSKKKRNKKSDFWALKDISFNVDKGEVVGLIGSNGAGKWCYIPNDRIRSGLWYGTYRKKKHIP